MSFVPTQVVYPCAEHGVIRLPFGALLDANGKLGIYPEVAGRGYFDIDYSGGELVLRATRYVGLIPVSDRVAIHVQPKAPIANLLRMIWRAGAQPEGLVNFIRGYAVELGSVDDPETLYVATFLAAMRRIATVGVLKRYQRREDFDELRGRLLLDQTIVRFRSKGIAHAHVFDVHDLTVDNLENRIIKHTAGRLLRRFLAVPTTEGRAIARELQKLLWPFSAVDSGPLSPSMIARRVPGLIRGLPNFHRFYEPALWLAYLISTKSGVAMEKVGEARFETLLIDVASIFERYVRRVIEEAAPANLDGCYVHDGNRQQVPLFATTQQYLTQPDYYFRRAGVAVALADAKYKPRVSTEDRYELLSFCEALNVRRAAFICPRLDDRTDPVTHHGTTIGGREIRIVLIDLAAADMDREENLFLTRLRDALGFAQPAANAMAG